MRSSSSRFRSRERISSCRSLSKPSIGKSETCGGAGGGGGGGAAAGAACEQCVLQLREGCPESREVHRPHLRSYLRLFEALKLCDCTLHLLELLLLLLQTREHIIHPASSRSKPALSTKSALRMPHQRRRGRQGTYARCNVQAGGAAVGALGLSTRVLYERFSVCTCQRDGIKGFFLSANLLRSIDTRDLPTLVTRQ